MAANYVIPEIPLAHDFIAKAERHAAERSMSLPMETSAMKSSRFNPETSRAPSGIFANFAAGSARFAGTSVGSPLCSSFTVLP
ncbi:MAG: hypothetical protein ACREF9_21010 [Opitutaceae bacterium]